MGAMIEALARIGWTLAEALEAEEDLEQVGKALNREAAIRSVMKIRACSREDAAKIVDGK
jgi:hypothetical protein